jgi:hypothetical protein
MITEILSRRRLLTLLAGFVLFGSHAPRTACAAGETTFQVQLIWGTNGEKPKDKPLKPVDPKLMERLRGVFKWKDYYEVNRKPLTLPKDGSQKLKMSDKCDIQVQDVGTGRIEIKLFGEGTLVVKKVQTVVPGEVIVLAGDSKDNTAWFVVLTPSK